jgi:hypothetical protein
MLRRLACARHLVVGDVHSKCSKPDAQPRHRVSRVIRQQGMSPPSIEMLPIKAHDVLRSALKGANDRIRGTGLRDNSTTANADDTAHSQHPGIFIQN